MKVLKSNKKTYLCTRKSYFFKRKSYFFTIIYYDIKRKYYDIKQVIFIFIKESNKVNNGDLGTLPLTTGALN